ncbi:hypothetical protein [Clostridium sp. HV4-5-A1G]|uniref:hypothetical protein n=2 Tax=unclassified Clostridium TaxID=2614128 RepID=UPI00123A6609|nr:hypothetical protein [Clostridium sp. HV4-5-A1G]KAA8676357.1 hypothetical protein F3O63_03345 [Clostridium sp. HV4-5-A1G]
MLKKYNCTVNDKVFAVIIVAVMCMSITAIPTIIFCKGILAMWKTNLIIINGTNKFEIIMNIIKFMILTLVIITVVDLIFSSVLEKKSGIKQNMIELTLMYLVFLLYAIIYSHFSINNKLIIKKEGIPYMSIYLFVLYVLLLISFKIIGRLYKKIILKNRDCIK